MARLYRPYISVTVRCRVLLRQTGEFWIEGMIDENSGHLQKLCDRLLSQLADSLGCEVSDLHLDHDPPLALRPQFRTGLGKVRYEPDANDAAYLIYRSAANHDIKTRVRGDGAQFSDLALIRREKKRNRPPKPKRAWPKRSFPRRQA